MFFWFFLVNPDTLEDIWIKLWDDFYDRILEFCSPSPSDKQSLGVFVAFEPKHECQLQIH